MGAGWGSGMGQSSGISAFSCQTIGGVLQELIDEEIPDAVQQSPTADDVSVMSMPEYRAHQRQELLSRFTELKVCWCW